MFTKYVELVACGRGYGGWSLLSTHSHSWLPFYQQSSILLFFLFICYMEVGPVPAPESKP